MGVNIIKKNLYKQLQHCHIDLSFAVGKSHLCLTFGCHRCTSPDFTPRLSSSSLVLWRSANKCCRCMPPPNVLAVHHIGGWWEELEEDGLIVMAHRTISGVYGMNRTIRRCLKC